MAENKTFADSILDETFTPIFPGSNALGTLNLADAVTGGTISKAVKEATKGALTTPFPIAKSLVSIADAQLDKARKIGAYDPITGNQTPTEAAVASKSQVDEIFSKLQGFPDITPEFVAEQLKVQQTFYESPDLDINITDASPENLNRAINLLGSEKDVNRKIMAALAVEAIASQRGALNMNSYMNQARQSLGLDQLETQIALNMQADMRAPDNPGDGTFSPITQELIDRKTNLMAGLPSLAQQYAQMDPTIAGPLAAARAVLGTMPAAERLAIARETKTLKVAEINSITDTEAKNYAAMTGTFSKTDWNNPISIFAAKKDFYKDKEFQKLSQTNILSVNDPVIARNLWVTAATPLEKQKSFAILQRLESDYLGVNEPEISQSERQRRISKYEENTKLLQAAYNAPLDPKLVKGIDTEVMLVQGSTKEKDQRRKELEAGYRETRLQEVLIRRFTNDVTQWKGINNVDSLVQQTINNVKKSTGKSNVPLDAFVGEYLNLPSNLTYSQKLKNLQGYIYSSTQDANQSAVLPSISGEQIYNKVAPGSMRIWLNSVMQGGVRG